MRGAPSDLLAWWNSSEWSARGRTFSSSWTTNMVSKPLPLFFFLHTSYSAAVPHVTDGVRRHEKCVCEWAVLGGQK